MKTVEAREFILEGLAIFKGWLDRAEQVGSTRMTAEPPPLHILEDDRYSKRLGFNGRLPLRRFEKKYDLGISICAGLGREDAERMLMIPNAWPWLSLLYHESTIPQKNGKWWTGNDARHIVQTIHGRRQDQSHRHLVKSAVTNVLRFGEHAAVLMDKIAQSKIEEQVMSRRDDPPLAYHVEFIRALHRLYWDIDANEVKTGASSTGPGSIMHMMDLLSQFDLTFDIASLAVDDFMRLLPNDFKRFIDGEVRARSARRRPSADRRPEAPPLMAP